MHYIVVEVKSFERAETLWGGWKLSFVDAFVSVAAL
jgi:hypothetical protein